MKGQMPLELRKFLLEKVRIGKIGVKRPNGRAWVQPVWFALDGDDVLVGVTSDSVLGRALRSDRYAILCVDDEEPPFAFAVLEGPVEIEGGVDVAANYFRSAIPLYRPDLEDFDEYHAELMRWEPFLARLKVGRTYYESRESKG